MEVKCCRLSQLTNDKTSFFGYRYLLILFDDHFQSDYFNKLQKNTFLGIAPYQSSLKASYYKTSTPIKRQKRERETSTEEISIQLKSSSNDLKRATTQELRRRKKKKRQQLARLVSSFNVCVSKANLRRTFVGAARSTKMRLDVEIKSFLDIGPFLTKGSPL